MLGSIRLVYRVGRSPGSVPSPAADVAHALGVPRSHSCERLSQVSSALRNSLQPRVLQELHQLPRMARLNAVRAAAYGVFPRGRIIAAAEAVHIDQRLRAFRDRNGLAAENPGH